MDNIKGLAQTSSIVVGLVLKLEYVDGLFCEKDVLS